MMACITQDMKNEDQAETSAAPLQADAPEPLVEHPDSATAIGFKTSVNVEQGRHHHHGKSSAAMGTEK